MAPRRASRIAAFCLISALPLVASLVTCATAFAQPKPPAGKGPPGTKTDMELDPDAKPAPPPEPPPLPPSEPGAWGVGGKDEEGKYAPSSERKKKEEEKKEQQKEDDQKPVDLGPARTAGVDVVFGFGTIRDVTNDTGLDGGKTHVAPISIVLSFNWRLFEYWNLGARFAFSKASISGPLMDAKDDYNTYAAGNLELYARPSFKLTSRLRLPAEVGLFLPTAQGDLFGDITTNGRLPLALALVNQAAAASRGWEDNPLFASKRFGVRAGVGITYDTESIHFAADTRFDLMAKVGGNDAPDGFNLRSQTFTSITGASFFYGFAIKQGFIEPGLRTWLAYGTVPITTASKDYSGPQFVLEPGVRTAWPVTEDKSMWVKGGVGVILPIAGPVGGEYDSSIKSFRMHAEFAF